MKVFIKYLKLEIILKQILALKKKNQTKTNNKSHIHNTELMAGENKME